MQATSQPKSKQREILNWPIREQGIITTLVVSQWALAQVISQSALARFLAHTYHWPIRMCNQKGMEKWASNSSLVLWRLLITPSLLLYVRRFDSSQEKLRGLEEVSTPILLSFFHWVKKEWGLLRLQQHLCSVVRSSCACGRNWQLLKSQSREGG